MFAFRVLFALLSFVLSAFAVDVTGRFHWNDECPDIHALGPARVVLDAGKLNGSVLRDGSFSIPDVPAGTYILSVVSHDHAFDHLRIDVLESTFEVRPYSVGTPLNPASSIVLPQISLIARAKHVYFVPVDSFNLVAMFQNPMMLMLLFGGVMVIAMPYLMKNMDPETMKDFKEQQVKLSQMQSAMASGDLKGGFSALIADDPPPPKALPASPAGSKKGNNNSKKRR
ncbi:hypothetical protein DFH08DRAFT_850928 [Mycena albidolilacea]|uniref:ER membrane protein complex subunit 7 beta-sandwich domain-containing protein n=1 Tax=Mycena albidolilacea TaxID=1033008 RepID=A0AAD7AFB4_9AGAR|nr:hypothetical protein DFH08DRAFT_850928 [Mycena albidolilacea]